MSRFEIYANNSYRCTVWAHDEESAIIDFLADNPKTMHRDRVTAVKLPTV